MADVGEEGFEGEDEGWPLPRWMEGDSLAPFRRSTWRTVRLALSMVKVTPQDVVYDLGCGDGRFNIAATELYGARGVGLEIEEDIAELARGNVAAAGVEDLVEIRTADVLSCDLGEATVVVAALLPEGLEQLRDKLNKALGAGARVACVCFPLENAAAEVISDGEHRVYAYNCNSFRIPPPIPAVYGQAAKSLGSVWQGFPSERWSWSSPHNLPVFETYSLPDDYRHEVDVIQALRNCQSSAGTLSLWATLVALNPSIQELSKQVDNEADRAALAIKGVAQRLLPDDIQAMVVGAQATCEDEGWQRMREAALRLQGFSWPSMWVPSVRTLELILSEWQL
eukprot:jgi/Chlat1/6491/Chrsp45S00471